ncbi:uncharacterized protein MONOS_18434 [Monocercomonoides exilis]|uniref:uncharacterized protein n=1 Tax=Monocercomonoides exilis TaxID=2049356 RepID=UPI0035597935|nr:hypothetical protein MONOS_18434 [Monocercomonoides exilis]
MNDISNEMIIPFIQSDSVSVLRVMAFRFFVNFSCGSEEDIQGLLLQPSFFDVFASYLSSSSSCLRHEAALACNISAGTSSQACTLLRPRCLRPLPHRPGRHTQRPVPRAEGTEERGAAGEGGCGGDCGGRMYRVTQILKRGRHRSVVCEAMDLLWVLLGQCEKKDNEEEEEKGKEEEGREEEEVRGREGRGIADRGEEKKKEKEMKEKEEELDELKEAMDDERDRKNGEIAEQSKRTDLEAPNVQQLECYAGRVSRTAAAGEQGSRDRSEVCLRWKAAEQKKERLAPRNFFFRSRVSYLEKEKTRAEGIKEELSRLTSAMAEVNIAASPRSQSTNAQEPFAGTLSLFQQQSCNSALVDQIRSLAAENASLILLLKECDEHIADLDRALAEVLVKQESLQAQAAEAKADIKRFEQIKTELEEQAASLMSSQSEEQVEWLMAKQKVEKEVEELREKAEQAEELKLKA